LSSWWTKIVIGVLMLSFIGVQAVLANRKVGIKALDAQAVRQNRKKFALGFGAVAILVILAILITPKLGLFSPSSTTEIQQCEVKPFRKDEASSLIEGGAVIAYHRLAGPNCVDEMYAIYPDGLVLGDNGESKLEKMVTPVDVEMLLKTITEDYKWYGNEIRDTYHVPCRQCYAHFVIVAHDDKVKGTTAVDGGVNMPPEYGFTLSVIRPLLPEFNPSP